MWMVEKVCNKTTKDIYIASCAETGGIYHYKMINGDLTFVDVTRMDRPMYMIIKEQKMYIILRAPFTSGESGLVVYDIDTDGNLVNPSEIMSTKGEVACHLTVDGEDIYCVNYISGSVIRMPELLVEHTGHGIHPQRQESPHTHYVGFTPDHKYVCVTDLGLDTIFMYDTNLKCCGKVKVPEGHGVRHLVFSDDGKYLFTANELQSTVSAFEYNGDSLKLIDTKSCLPKDFKGESATAAIRFHNGHIYVSNRGHDSITIMQQCNEDLKVIGYIDCRGKTPRDFVIADNYILCANQDSDNVTVLDENNEYIAKQVVPIRMPVCICVGEEK